MSSSVIDTPWHTTNALDCLKQEGIKTVIRYYNNGNSSGLPQKRLEPTEAQALSNAGFQIMVVFQTSQNQASDFSEAQGYAAGKSAFEWAKNTIGQPQGSAIYFAVDYNASESDLQSAIIPYFQGVKQAFLDLGEGEMYYKIGAYGSGLVVNTIMNEGISSFRWLSMSTGFYGTQQALEDGNYELHQLYPSAVICNIAVDYDAKKADDTNIGSWQLNEGATA